MTRLAASLLRKLAFVAALLASGMTHAVTITDFGVDTETRHYTIGAGSTVTYTPWLFGGDPGTFSVSGSFDALLSRYWWKYFLDGDPLGSLGTFLFESNWVQFVNPNLVGSISPDGFRFPDYFVRVDGDLLAGDSGACNFPAGPDFYCTGFDTFLDSLTGRITPDSIVLNGYQPTGFFDEFSYHINASVVPLPTTTALMVLGIGLIGLCRIKERNV